jgi:hypothetical protein
VLPAQFQPCPDADTIPRRLEPLPKFYTCLWRWAKRKPETCNAEVNRWIILKLVHYVGHYKISFQMHGPYNIKKMDSMCLPSYFVYMSYRFFCKALRHRSAYVHLPFLTDQSP